MSEIDDREPDRFGMTEEQSDAWAEARIAKHRKLFAEVKLPQWKINVIERTEGWTFPEPPTYPL